MDATIANSSNQTQRTRAKSGQGGIQIARNEFFAGLFLLGCANGIASRAIARVHDNGWLNAAIGMFDVSAIALAACALGLWLMMGGRAQSVTRIDLAIGVVALALIALPIDALSWIRTRSVYSVVHGPRSVDATRGCRSVGNDCTHVLEPFAFSAFCKLHSGNRRIIGRVAAWRGPDRQYDSLRE